MLTSDQIIRSIAMRNGLKVKPEVRCPHDGGACHHNCVDDSEPSCFRENGGMSLSSPCEGYPVDSKEFFNSIIVNRILDL